MIATRKVDMSADSSASVSVSYLTEPTDAHALLRADVLQGFTADRKNLPSKYFYDARGSRLFDRITQLPEYYLTRAETEILDSVAEDLMNEVQPDELIELGSGSSTKTLLLIGAMERHGGRRYVPIDVSEAALRGAAEQLGDRFDWLEIDALVGDYVTDLAKVRRRGRRVIMFFGSTIGNYEPAGRGTLLRSVSAALAPGDRFLLGVDLVKDEATMLAAYDDAQGVSAEFNRNILHVVNKQLGGDIPADEFEHVPSYDPSSRCIEHHLRARRDIVAYIGALDLEVTFMSGEEIKTEVSCKFTRPQVEGEFRSAGIELVGWHTDSSNRFAVAFGASAGATADSRGADTPHQLSDETTIGTDSTATGVDPDIDADPTQSGGIHQ